MLGFSLAFAGHLAAAKRPDTLIGSPWTVVRDWLLCLWLCTKMTRPSRADERGRRSMMPTIDRAVDHSLRNAILIIFHLPRKNQF